VYKFNYVEISSESDSPGDNEPPPTKRRVAQPSLWARNNRAKKVVVTEKEPCSCQNRCYRHIGQSRRKKMRTAFQLLERDQQKAFMRGLVRYYAHVGGRARVRACVFVTVGQCC